MNPVLNSIDQTYQAWSRGIVELVREPLKPISHPSVWRMRWLGLLITLGNPLFYYIWTNTAAPLTEHLTARLLISLLGIVIFVENRNIASSMFFWKWFCVLTLFIQLPVFFIYMAVENDFHSIWLGSCVAMIMIYHQAADWRIASLSTLLVIVLAIIIGFFDSSHYLTSQNLPTFAKVFVFSWITALILSASAANLSKINTLNTAFNLGVMAHELRTPIASVGILSSVLKNKYAQTNDQDLLLLSGKLDILVKTINTHIDNQIINSKIITIKKTDETIKIKTLIDQVLMVFPYKNPAEQAIIRYSCADDFSFQGSATLYTQVFNNLIRNSLKALAAKELSDDSKKIELISYIAHGALGKKTACIDITDNGIGIKPQHIRQVLEPFFSTNQEIGHGLGLSFCKKVIAASNGSLSIKSIYGYSTTITIELPFLAHQ